MKSALTDAAERERMVREQIERRGVTNADVLRVLRTTPRHLFVPDGLRPYAYSDQALPIDFGQSISQPYIVALMTELLDPRKSDKVLEVGTGSGYQAGESDTIHNSRPGAQSGSRETI